MSALGRFQPFRTLSSQRPLSDAKQTLNKKIRQPKSDRQLSPGPVIQIAGKTSPRRAGVGHNRTVRRANYSNWTSLCSIQTRSDLSL